jgi:hypothetical protein
MAIEQVKAGNCWDASNKLISAAEHYGEWAGHVRSTGRSPGSFTVRDRLDDAKEVFQNKCVRE